MGPKISLKFLGIRALHDAPSASNTLYGGNTNCIVIQDGDHIFLINAGFGCNPFGDELLKRCQAQKKSVECHLFLGDFLWESIMGLPMFTPVHFKSSKIAVHSALPPAAAADRLSAICSKDLSPFDGVKSFNAPLNFAAPTANRTIGNWRISLLTLTHPMAPYPAAVWTFEHESGLSIGLSNQAPVNATERAILVEHLKGCTIVVQSAIAEDITHATMNGRWTFEEAIRFGQETGAEHTYLTGIHPSLGDLQLLQSEINLSRTLGLKSGPNFSIAREWAAIPLPFTTSQKKAG